MNKRCSRFTPTLTHTKTIYHTQHTHTMFPNPYDKPISSFTLHLPSKVSVSEVFMASMGSLISFECMFSLRSSQMTVSPDLIVYGVLPLAAATILGAWFIAKVRKKRKKGSKRIE